MSLGLFVSPYVHQTAGNVEIYAPPWKTARNRSGGGIRLSYRVSRSGKPGHQAGPDSTRQQRSLSVEFASFRIEGNACDKRARLSV
jgi:hypothetical protein